MTGAAPTQPAAAPLPMGGAEPGRHLWRNILAACVCLAWNAAVLVLSLELPAGHSRGDVGPGAVPMQIALLGLLISGLYLVQVLRGVERGGSDDPVDTPRVAGFIALFLAAAVGTGWIGLPLSLGLAAGLATLLFHGEKVILRAATTGVAFWAIAYFIFGKLLQLPLP